MSETATTAPAGGAEPYVFNPFAPGFTDDPYPHYAQMRAMDPVHEHPLGFWILARHDDVVALLRSKNSVEDRNAAPSPILELRVAAAGGDYSRPLAASMLDRDPPDHTRLRKLVSQAFTVRAVEALEPRVIELVDAALDRIEARIAESGQADLVAELAYPLPFAVICEMLGMPDTDHERLRELAGTLVRSLEPVTDPELIAAISAAGREISERIAQVIADKRRAPGDDLLTALIQAEDDGDVLSDEELLAQVVLLYVAGHETTVNLIANGSIALMRNPVQLALLASRPDLDANAVEELLRYDSPVQQSRRITLAPYEVGGRVIPTGTFVIANLASANRDEEFWGPDADQLRVDRPNARGQVSFGGGPHHCLGASLARLEGRVALGRLIRRFATLHLADSITWNGRLNLRGPLSVPVTTTT
ncbi:MAG TPA: cytochrome P450 [Pseudonocardia sp.]|jgi:cytochrome P450|uniref:cytochrome P450 n=1 Tax=Pseudonocardia sp. TaxID=60912 RepID=UPI002B9CFF02|nr:cytochrome P450 [Pseudonocardia sp.]HTF50725.1 cytochrome P450 [Pseudonocardia sp.]